MPPLTLRLDLPRDETAARAARERLHAVAGLMTEERFTDLCLVVTELVTNAVEHGEGPVTLRLQVGLDGFIRGVVTDRGNGVDDVLGADEATIENGIGLPVVDRVSSRWGVYAGSTNVWFELGAPSPGPTP